MQNIIVYCLYLVYYYKGNGIVDEIFNFNLEMEKLW